LVLHPWLTGAVQSNKQGHGEVNFELEYNPDWWLFRWMLPEGLRLQQQKDVELIFFPTSPGQMHQETQRTGNS
jgi:hypothetical protein